MSTIDLTTDTFSVYQEEDLAILTLSKGAKILATTVSGKEGLLDAMSAIKAAPQIKGLTVQYSDEYHGDDEYIKFLRENLEQKHYLGGSRFTITYKSALYQFLEEIIQFPVPVVGGFEGDVSPNTFAINLAFDVRIATDNFCIFHPNLKLGLPVSPFLSYYLVQSLGSPKASELMLTKSELSAQEALDLGLISQIVPQKDLKRTCIDKLRQMISIPGDALVESRRMLQPDMYNMRKYIDEGFDATIRCLHKIKGQ